MDLQRGPCVLFLLRLCFCRSRGTGLGVEVPDRVERRYQEVRASSPRQEGRCGPGMPNWGREGTGECASNGDTSRSSGRKSPWKETPAHGTEAPRLMLRKVIAGCISGAYCWGEPWKPAVLSGVVG